MEATTTQGRSAGSETVMVAVIISTFEVRWDRGSTWTGFDTRAEAEAKIAFSASHGYGAGVVVERQFDAEVTLERAQQLAEEGREFKAFGRAGVEMFWAPALGCWVTIPGRDEDEAVSS